MQTMCMSGHHGSLTSNSIPLHCDNEQNKQIKGKKKKKECTSGPVVLYSGALGITVD